MKILGTVKNGGFSSIRHLLTEISKHDGKAIEVTVRKKQSSRTIQQNKYLHVVLRMIAEETGHTEEEIKYHYAKKFLSYVSEDCIEMVSSTADLTIEEMIDFIDRIRADATFFFCLNIPEAEE